MHFLGGLLLVIVIFWLATRVAGPKAGVGAAAADLPIQPITLPVITVPVITVPVITLPPVTLPVITLPPITLPVIHL